RNKARLVAQRHTQEEGIEYDEVFAPVVRIEAIRLFLAYASFKDFLVYQMDVKSAFLYGKTKKEQAWKIILALDSGLCELGSQSPPFNLLEFHGFHFFLGPGSSGAGGEFLPSGFKTWGEHVISWGAMAGK
nr:ribonuclease H-like domain-containing protein [Tanacetum cinerariifolium]